MTRVKNAIIGILAKLAKKSEKGDGGDGGETRKRCAWIVQDDGVRRRMMM